jgi:hypothetical protein
LRIITLHIVLNLFIGFLVHGQYTKVRGLITDSETKEPMPFVNIIFKGTSLGTISDFKGEYYIETKLASADTLIFSYIGYLPKKIKVDKFRFQTLNVELRPDNIQLQEVVIKPGENPAHRILDSINARKIFNNPERLDAYQYEVYSKIEMDINNFDEEYKKQRVFRKFQFVFDYVDTNTITGKTYLPVFISETLSDYYFNRNPRGEKEVIKANKISGLNNESITQLTGNLYQNINLYNNWINIFDKGFVSPISNTGKAYYKYYLTDSLFIGNQWCYHISFKPRRKQEPTFTGDFWVHDTTFGIKSIKVRMADDANINLINDLVANYEYERVDNKTWFLKKEEIFVDFNLSDKQVGFFGTKTTSYKNIRFDVPYDSKMFSLSNNISLDNQALQKDEAFWNESRHDSLTKKEESIYQMVDSIKKVPMFKSALNLIMMFVTGYKVIDPLEFGPYYTFYSFNDLEGSRIRIGARTSNKFSTKFMPEGYVAYGVKDQKLKYGGGFIYLFNNLPKEGFGAFFKYDVEQIGQSQNAFLEDNILSSSLRRNPNSKLSMVTEFKTHYEKEWFQGFSNTLSLKHRTITPTENVSFKVIQPSGSIFNKPNIVTSEIKLNTRFAYKEKIVTGKFERMSLGTKYPIINLNLVGGLKGVLASDYSYFKANLLFDHWFNNNPFGWFSYVIDIGKVWGQVPYPLMQLHEGNETYAFDPYAFNMMNYYEFVSDQYISVNLEQHFEGFFLNRIPLMRKLKWREIAEWKGVYGSLDHRNKKVMMFPDKLVLSGLDVPYMEAGFGIENIFKIFRVDALWRLTYLDHKNISMFGIRAQIQFIF